MTQRLITALAAAAACAALPATAPAAPKYRSAAFEVQLNGEQISTWENHTDTLKDDPCGSKYDAYGDQTIGFGSTEEGRLLIGKPANGKPIMVLTNKKQTGAWAIGALADRNGTRIVDLGNNRGDCGDNGGGVPPRPREDKECGKRVGRLEVSMQPSGGSRAWLMGDSDGWSNDMMAPADGSATGASSLDETYEDCPFWEGGTGRYEADDALLPAKEKLPLEAMLSGKKRKFTIHFARAQDYRSGGFTGRTVVAGKVRLTRTTLTPAG